MEATGRYHEPVAAALHECGIYVCVLNPLYIKQSGGGSIRKVETDKADAMKIVKYGLVNWVDLREYTSMDTVRQQLKLCSRQYNLAEADRVISLKECTFLADKGYDVKSIYNTVKTVYDGEAFIPLNPRGTKDSKALPAGNPICKAGLAMHKDGKTTDNGRTRQKYCRPFR